MWTHHRGTNRSTHPQPCTKVQQYLVRSTAVTSTKSSTHPPMCYTAVQQMTQQCIDVYPVRTHSAPLSREWWNHHGSTKQKYETRQTPIATNTLDHPPTHPRRATAIRQSTTVVADALIQTELLCHWDFHALTIIRHPGERADPSPGGHLSTLPARWVGHGTRYALGTEKGCGVDGTWHHSEIAGGRVALGSRSCFLGVL